MSDEGGDVCARRGTEMPTGGNGWRPPAAAEPENDTGKLGVLVPCVSYRRRIERSLMSLFGSFFFRFSGPSNLPEMVSDQKIGCD